MKPRPVTPPPPALIGLFLMTGAFAVICGLAMLVAATVVLVNLAVDLLYPLIDPRIVLTKTQA